MKSDLKWERKRRGRRRAKRRRKSHCQQPPQKR
jgi:hypothetical protein